MDDRFGLVGLRLAEKYDVTAAVARGGFGLVYQAVHATLNKRVAIKVLMVPQELNEAAQESFMATFLQEAQMIAQLDHPAIVRVLDSGVGLMPNNEQAPWMALDWIDGQNLDAYLKSRRGHGGRPPAEALAFMQPIFSALGFAHDQGLAHRDIKPANIMMPDSGTTARQSRHAIGGLRLLDFGIAKMMDIDEQAGGGHTQTRSKSIAFSPLWAAPEQVGGARTGPWTDVHALALILTQVLTDRPPFMAQEQTELFGQVLSPNRPTPASVGVNVGSWEMLIARALSLRPADRYASAGDFLAALEEALPGARHQPLASGTVGTTIAMEPSSLLQSSQPRVPTGATLKPWEVSGSVASPALRRPFVLIGSLALVGLVVVGLGVGAVGSRVAGAGPTAAVHEVRTVPRPAAQSVAAMSGHIPARALPSSVRTAPTAPPSSALPPPRRRFHLRPHRIQRRLQRHA